jgi:hypothetical protein
VRHVSSSLHGERGIAGGVDDWETVTRSRPIPGDLVTCVRSWAPEDGFSWLDVLVVDALNGGMDQFAALEATFACLLDSPGDVPLRRLRLHDILLWLIATGNWDGTVAQGQRTAGCVVAGG